MMKKYIAGLLLLTALFVAGCETQDIAPDSPEDMQDVQDVQTAILNDESK